MTYHVYALKSQKDGRIYVGMSSNVINRLKEHNAGEVKSTKGFRPWDLVHEEVIHGTRQDARNREKYLKSGSGKEFLKSIILPR